MQASASATMAPRGMLPAKLNPTAPTAATSACNARPLPSARAKRRVAPPRGRCDPAQSRARPLPPPRPGGALARAGPALAWQGAGPAREPQQRLLPLGERLAEKAGAALLDHGSVRGNVGGDHRQPK